MKYRFSVLGRDFSISGGLWMGSLLIALLWVSPVMGQDMIRLDNHTKTYPENEVIPDWDDKKISPLFGSGDKFYFRFVHKSDQEHYLHLASGDDNSFSVGSTKAFEVPQYPILEWEWKITKLPKGGDVRIEDKDDQAGSMCLVVDPGLTGFDSLCYVWENKGPKNTPITSSKRDASKYIILRTPGDDQLGKWYKEKRNIHEDYKKLFGKEPDEKAVIGVQIDSDDTESSGEAFYRNIILRKR
ncbi:MAG: DUF3047 domain-containing protein [SAR324 cluster bacterium]|nr:DUF3047 domain-containing protein [SAR324 cluster bacterium]